MSKEKVKGVEEAKVVKEKKAKKEKEVPYIDILTAEKATVKANMQRLADNISGGKIPDDAKPMAQRQTYAMVAYYELLCMQIGVLSK